MLRGRVPTAAVDAAGLALAVGLVAWSFRSADMAGGDALPVAALISGCIGALLAGRLASLAHPALPPVTILAIGVVVALGSREALLSGAPLSGPLGYANANAALFSLFAVAGLMAAAAIPGGIGTAIGVLAFLAFGAAPLVVGAVASAGVVVLCVVAVLTGGWGHARLGIALSAAAFLLVLGGTMALGATYEPGDRSGPVARLADGVLTERRVVLWHDAIRLMLEEPMTGVGPGRFQETSPTALGDIDARWAHNGFLQQGAETGVPGLLLTVGLFLWAFVRLALHPDPHMVTVLGAASVAALGILASLDYVLHFPAVPLAAAVLTGSAIGARPSRIELAEGVELIAA